MPLVNGSKAWVSPEQGGWEVNIEIPVPISIALILLGIVLILFIIPEWVAIVRAVSKRKIPTPREATSKIGLVIAGIFIAGLGFYLLLGDRLIDQPSVCAYGNVTDAEAIRWLIDQETQAVVSENITLIKGIFQDEAKIIDYFDKSAPIVWSNPLDRYQTLFRDYEFIDAQNTNIRSMGAINGDTAYYMSGSHGTYIHNGQTSRFQNPDDASHWTVTRVNGCWKIAKFDFNASGVAFP